MAIVIDADVMADDELEPPRTTVPQRAACGTRTSTSFAFRSIVFRVENPIPEQHIIEVASFDNKANEDWLVDEREWWRF